MSGFDGVSTGILNSLNNQIETAQKQHQEGDIAQFQAFQEASKQYQSAKDKNAEEADKIESLANVISQGKPDPMAYSVARDGVEMGYTGAEHLPYLMDAYKHTKADAMQNPDKWNIVVDTQNHGIDQGFTPQQDTNPANTKSLQKFNPNLTATDVENVRQNRISKPYSNLPGASFGNPEDTINQQVKNRTLAEGQAKQQMEDQASGWPGEQSQAQGGASIPPPPSPAGGGGTNPMVVPASQLQPPGQQQQPQEQNQPGQDPGIKLNGPAPAEGGGLSGPPPIKGTPPELKNAQPLDYQSASNIVPGATPSRGEYVTGQKLDYEYLHSLPSSIQANVLGIAQGRLNITDVVPRSMGASGQALRAKYFNAVQQFDPSFDETNYRARLQANAGLNNPNSKIGQQIISINRLAQHLDKLDSAIGDLPNLHAAGAEGVPLSKQGPPLFTGLENRIGRAAATGSGSAAYTTFETDKKAVVDEMTRLWRGTGGNKSDIEERAKELDSANTPEQLHSALKASVGLIQGQIDPIQSDLDRSLGLHTRDILTPKTREIYNRIGGQEQPMTDQQTQQPHAPAGGSPTPDTPPTGIDQNTGQHYYTDPKTGRTWIKQQ